MAGIYDVFQALQNIAVAANQVATNIGNAIAKGWAAGSVTGVGPSLSLTGGTLAVTPLASSQATPANPATTTDMTGVMMGLHGAITPTATGKVLMIVSGTIFNSTLIGDGAVAGLRYGTGTAPANGDALTGTAVGGATVYVASTTAGSGGFSLNAVVTGLVATTPYWIDVALAAQTGGSAGISAVSISTIELE